MSVERALDLLETEQKRARGVVTARDPADVPVTAENPLRSVLSYLEHFGYFKELLSGWGNITLEDILAALKDFQSMAGLPKSDGHVTPRVVKLMAQPRCGVPDIIRPHHKEFQGMFRAADAMLNAWVKRGLTWYRQSYTGGIDQATQDAIVQKAFDSWTQYGPLTVQRTNDPNAADIVISTGQGPQSNFDGPGGVLAWCYLPNGQDSQLLMEFDLAESWCPDATQNGIPMINVATHELGHGLGLTHSNLQSALMAPVLNRAIATPQQRDDIPRFEARYPGGPAQPQQPSNPPATKPSVVISGDVSISLNGRQLA